MTSSDTIYYKVGFYEHGDALLISKIDFAKLSVGEAKILYHKLIN
jgi:hypothetical protein